MTNVNADASQGGDDNNEPTPLPAPPGPAFHCGNKVYKSGPLFLASKGIGWTSWKKRWFILTQTSLVFFRNDPNVVPQKVGEVNLTLGGIDLNSSGSIVVKEDKKLITVNFPDGRDGRAFTLKAETLEDLNEWKNALEEALSKAPNVGQNGKIKKDQTNNNDVSSEQSKDSQAKSMVIGRPVLLALEDIDGTPSFLEKALRFVEEFGVRTEGILRQAADVDDVEHRIREFEKGKIEFLPEEDAHVIADCVKYVLRELPSSPVPASCCKALVEACRTERGMRVNAIRSAICETFPEPNRRLLQRILIMMETVAFNKTVNRMSTSAVAACMAPLLLRPLLAGDCELENDFDVGGDGSLQLLQAAAAANHAQTIVITLLEEYDNIFGEGSVPPEPYTDSEESGSMSEEITDEDEDSFDDDGDYVTENSLGDVDKDLEHDLSADSSDTAENEYHKSPETPLHDANKEISLSPSETAFHQPIGAEKTDNASKHCSDDPEMRLLHDDQELLGTGPCETSVIQPSSKALHGHASSVRRPAVWGRAPARKNLSMESLDIPFEEEDEIQKLESFKTDLQNKISKESKVNSLLQVSLEKRKHDLHERRQALEKEVTRLQEQLKKEIEMRTALEAGLRIPEQPLSSLSFADVKTKAELVEIAREEVDVSNLKQKANDLELQLSQHREQNSRIQHVGNQLHPNPHHQSKSKKKQIDVGALTIPSASENSSRSKHDYYLDSLNVYKDQKLESPSSTRNSLPLNRQMDVAWNSRATGGLAMMPGTELGAVTPVTTSSRKSNSKSEERRSQIANELQNLDKEGKSPRPIQNLGQGRGSEHLQLHLDSKRPLEKGQQLGNNESFYNSDNPKVDGGTKREGPSTLELGKSENFQTPNQSRSKIAPRTFPR